MAGAMFVIYSVLSPKIQLGFWGGIVIGATSGIAGSVIYIVSCIVLKVDILLDFIKGVKNK